MPIRSGAKYVRSFRTRGSATWKWASKIGPAPNPESPLDALRVGERPAIVVLDLGFEAFDSPAGDDVLEAGELAVFAVAVVALDFEESFDGLENFVRRRSCRSSRTIPSRCAT